MPIDTPAGYLTRPEAAKKYNRSQRALERDLNIALTLEDQELLSHWKLITKDGAVRDGGVVTTEMVRELVTNKMTPAWCVAESFLDEKFGRKGLPRPDTSDDKSSDSDSAASLKESTDRKSMSSRPEAITDNVAFLKDTIHRLEQEKEHDRERFDRMVTKLFDQLDVKDKQISAWDEVTQGLTKALATGQITPNLGLLRPGAQPPEESPIQSDEPASPEVSPAAAVVDPTSAMSGPGSKEEGNARSRKRSTRQRNKRMNAARPKLGVEKQPTKNHKWYETPTLKRLFSRTR